MEEESSSQVEVRRLWPADKESFRDHLLRLDPQSRHERFGGGMSDDFLVHYAENCFGKGDLVYGAFVDGKMVGAGELRSNRAIWSEQAPFGRQHPRRGCVLGRGGLSAPGHRRKTVQAHPARRDQSRRRDDRDRLPARQHWDAEPGEEVQDRVHVRGERADRPLDRASADRVVADARSLGRCVRFRRRAVRRPLAGGG